MNDEDFQALKAKIDRLCDAVENKYKTTEATATQCFKELDDGLMELGMEPDCVVLWQVLNDFADAEEEWDSLTTEQQAGQDLPKGKQRKA